MLILPQQKQVPLLPLRVYSDVCLTIKTSFLPINKVPPPWTTLWIFALSALAGLFY